MNKTRISGNHLLAAVFLLVILLPLSIKAQDSLPTTKEYLLSYPENILNTVVSPFRWNSKQWTVAGSATLITAGLYFVDEEINQWAIDENSNNISTFSRSFLEPWGSGLYTLPALGILYGTGRITESNRLSRTALYGLEAWLLAGGMAGVAKYSLGRYRPFQSDPPDAHRWNGPFTMEYTSFPSGHTITIFAAATVFASEYKDKPWIGVLSYTIAGLTGISRIAQNRHWASDVFAGAVLGYCIGRLVWSASKNKKIRFTLVPGSGVNFSCMF
jgi:membrane-associated phospholipid phosphatase